MVNYQLGKIYKIVCNKTGLIYVGSTCEPTLAKRLAKHKVSYNQHLKNQYPYNTSFKIIENGDYDIVLLESYPCESKDELHKKERYYIESLECVNRNTPSRTVKDYYEEHKEKILEYHKKYYDDNNEKIREQIKEHREANKDEIKKRSKQYYDAHKDEINEKRKQLYADNSEKIKQQVQKYRDANKDEINKRQRELRALKKQQQQQNIN